MLSAFASNHSRGRDQLSILLKNPKNASTRLSMNGKSPMISSPPRSCCGFSNDGRRVFQQNHPSLAAVLGFDGDGHLGDAGLAGVVHHIDHPAVLDPLIGVDQDQ